MKAIYTVLLSLSVLIISVECSRTSHDQSGSLLPSKIQADSGQQTARGYVFHDKNNNLIKDSEEKGISGIIVSNGADLVQTDESGMYEIPVSEDAIVFVIKPANWKTPVDENNLPQFFYRHNISGSPENYTFPGEEPTGALPEFINFPLHPSQNPEQFKIAVFGDTQPYNIEQVDFIAEDIIPELAGRSDIAFGLTMGDIVGDDLSLFEPLNQTIAKIGLPWYNVMGNHDINYMSPNDELSDETYERVYGPATYAFEYGKVNFIVMDDIIHESEAGSHNYTGGLREDQIMFIRNYLATVPKENLVVLNMHIPFETGKEGYDTYRDKDQEAIFELLKDFPNTLSISAHTHIHDNIFFHKDSSVWPQDKPHHHYNTGTTCGSWWTGFRGETDIPHTMMRDGTPNGYSIITFNGNKYVTDWIVAGSREDHKMNIHIPRGIVANSADTVLLTVNFFNGSVESEVQYRIDGLTEWTTMNQVFVFDPFFMKLVQRWKNIINLGFQEQWENDPEASKTKFPGYKIPRPEKCTHIWQDNIGSDFPAGRYLIEVKATDRYGRTFIDYHPMRVVE